jgi:hypothetical protein
VPGAEEFRGLEGLSLRGEFGRWLKARERWLSVEELHAGLKWKDALPGDHQRVGHSAGPLSPGQTG